MQLSIIIVNFKSAGLIVDCLQTVFRQNSELGFEIIIADNASGDDSSQRILSEFPQVKWIQLEYNAGFARANNAGIREAKGEVVLLLNPDTLNIDNAIEDCFQRLLNSEFVAAGVQLLNVDGTPQISGNFFMTGGLNHLMALPYLGRLIRWLGFRMKIKKTNVAKADGTVEVDWVNGAFLMAKKEVINKAGLLDEDFFLYSEEIEWCSRLRKQGKICIYGDLHVTHLQGESATKAFGSAEKGYYNLTNRKGLQIMLSGMVRIRKQFGFGWFLVHLLAYMFTIPVFFILALINTILVRPGRSVEWREWRGFTKNVFIVCSYFFRIITNRPYFYKVL